MLDRLRPRLKGGRPSRWTCSATRCGQRASTPSTSTRLRVRRPRRPAWTRQLCARAPDGRRARRLGVMTGTSCPVSAHASPAPPFWLEPSTISAPPTNWTHCNGPIPALMMAPCTGAKGVRASPELYQVSVVRLPINRTTSSCTTSPRSTSGVLDFWATLPADHSRPLNCAGAPQQQGSLLASYGVLARRWAPHSSCCTATHTSATCSPASGCAPAARRCRRTISTSRPRSSASWRRCTTPSSTIPTGRPPRP